MVSAEEGTRISWSGFAKRASMWEAVSERGDRARFLRGRLERGSAEVGMLSGMGSDILDAVCFIWRFVWRWNMSAWLPGS